jgi:hypothetical protein
MTLKGPSNPARSAAPANAFDLSIDDHIFLIDDLLRRRCRCGNIG